MKILTIILLIMHSYIFSSDLPEWYSKAMNKYLGSLKNYYWDYLYRTKSNELVSNFKADFVLNAGKVEDVRIYNTNNMDSVFIRKLNEHIKTWVFVDAPNVPMTVPIRFTEDQDGLNKSKSFKTSVNRIGMESDYGRILHEKFAVYYRQSIKSECYENIDTVMIEINNAGVTKLLESKHPCSNMDGYVDMIEAYLWEPSVNGGLDTLQFEIIK